VSTIQTRITDVGARDGLTVFYQRTTDNNQVHAVTALTPGPSTWVIGVFSAISVQVSEGVHATHAVLVCKELGVEVCPIFDMLHRRRSQVRVAINPRSRDVHVADQDDAIALLLQLENLFQHMLVKA
jgi:hypothetical protein